MLKRLIAVALVAGGVALPVCAQRGGGARGGSIGHSGGFASHSAPAFRNSAPSFRSSFAPMGRGPFMGAPQPSGNRMSSAIPAFRGSPLRNGTGFDGRRPGNGYGADRYRRPYVPYYGLGYPYGLSGWVASNYPGYLDPGLYDYGYSDPAYGDNNSGYAYSDPGYAAMPSPSAYPGGYGPGPAEPAQLGPESAYRQVYQRPEPEPAPENAVTLIFKDGRPPEEIHNYMLTRTTLYVQEQRMRQISVADLDLAATEKVNREAGVDFRVPDSGR
jgi:hypothetical protein